jgi:hypothetical protein
MLSSPPNPFSFVEPSLRLRETDLIIGRSGGDSLLD